MSFCLSLFTTASVIVHRCEVLGAMQETKIVVTLDSTIISFYDLRSFCCLMLANRDCYFRGLSEAEKFVVSV